MIIRLIQGLYSVGTRLGAAGASVWMRSRRRWNKESVAQRFGRSLPESAARFPIWIHAASMGEVRVGSALASALHARSIHVMGTAMTETGYELAKSTYPAGSTLIRAPFDLKSAVGALIERYRPVALIVIETEFWPNMLTVADEHSIPIFVVNGRLSDKSFPSYRRTRWFWRKILSGIDRFFMRSQIDAERIIALGVDAQRVEATGSLKAAVMSQPSVALPAAPSTGRPMWIAGSTRPGEEEILLAAHAELRNQFPTLQLWLAPRHPERFASVGQLIRNSGLIGCPWSEIATRTGGYAANVILVDQMGILRDLYRHAQIAFVGGSLKPFGGHNPLEPAQAGVPVIFGPHMNGQRESADRLLRDGLAVVVESQTDIVRQVVRALQSPESPDERSRRAHAFNSRAAGIIERVVDDILARIGRSPIA